MEVGRTRGAGRRTAPQVTATRSTTYSRVGTAAVPLSRPRPDAVVEGDPRARGRHRRRPPLTDRPRPQGLAEGRPPGRARIADGARDPRSSTPARSEHHQIRRAHV